MTIPKPALQNRSRISLWIRFILFMIGLVFIAIMSGFFAFANLIERQALPQPIPKVDGIVVLTGAGGGRLEAGGKLLANDYGERLLISGVNNEISREQVLSILSLPPTLSACCVDLDYAARNTVENALEAESWARALGYEHILLVTSAYHMPRAKLELSQRSRYLRVTPYPVISLAWDKKWWRDKDHRLRLFKEYGKVLLTYTRNPGSRAADDRVPTSHDLPL